MSDCVSLTGQKLGQRSANDVFVFHAGTKSHVAGTRTAGGRVLGVTALGESAAAAREKAYQSVGKIRFDGATYRTDIAANM